MVVTAVGWIMAGKTDAVAVVEVWGY